MLKPNGPPRLFLCLRPTDMRRSFTGLSALIYEHGGRPDDGAYYVFVNRQRTQVKVLHWDGAGLALWHRRLERGRLALPPCRGGRVELDRRLLALLPGSMVPPQRPPEGCR
jgi:transposase